MATPLAYITTVREEVTEASQTLARSSTAHLPAVQDPTAYVPRSPVTPYQSANPASTPRLATALTAQSVAPEERSAGLPESEFRDAVQLRINDGFGTRGEAVAEAKAGNGGRSSMPIYNSINPVGINDSGLGSLYFEADAVVMESANRINGPQFNNNSDALAAAQAIQASRGNGLPVPYNLLGTN